MGRADDPYVHARFPLRPNAAEAAVVEEAQQLRLKVQRHLADLVEEHRPAVGELEQPGLAVAPRPEKAPEA